MLRRGSLLIPQGRQGTGAPFRHPRALDPVSMDHLDRLESQSVYILREAFNRIDRLAMLWSLGKVSNVMVWLARKAFFGSIMIWLRSVSAWIVASPAAVIRSRSTRVGTAA